MYQWRGLNGPSDFDIRSVRNDRLGIKNYHIMFSQHHIPAGNQDTVFPFYYGHDNTFRKVELRNAAVDPGIPFGQVNLDEVDVGFLAVFTHPFDSGILINESGGNDTGGDGDHSDAQESDEYAEHFSQCGDGIDITVAYSEQCGGSPPDP